jgi:hypothetical protein
MSSGKMREFETGATREDASEKLDLEGFLSPLALRRYSEYLHKHRHQADGKLRDSDNWQKGIPVEAYRKSLLRHVMEAWLAWRGHSHKESLEDSLCAIIFNAQGMLHELLKTAPSGHVTAISSHEACRCGDSKTVAYTSGGYAVCRECGKMIHEREGGGL